LNEDGKEWKRKDEDLEKELLKIVNKYY